ncbi:RraA family protein [Chengkuizengella axinellae]|uniref:Putative 4-hydroxy-4-methyl-2-oxoglutarate aldolase n=1 Tax=Chengkuizengella axinellae TaxID=3064388 RepID=A0ABT9IZQ7_9BACL|nr:RraA family protein [Chengkuizengella sp. 2205SS18-9]MDP5274803.1 RraA family protein [Chengkuizengella sp. 2205SS18-9]
MSERITVSKFDKLSIILHSAVISDVLDDLGYTNQVVHSGLKGLDSNSVVMGRAFTVLAVDVYQQPESPYQKQMEAVDHLKKGDLFVVTTNGSTRSAFWGELLSTSARARGARGAIVDGLTRDTAKIIEMKFPVFTKGFIPIDSKGRNEVIDYNVPIECGGVKIQPDDLMFGDRDGIVVVPQKVESLVIQKALEKLEAEDKVREKLLEGVTTEEVYKELGVL